MTNENFPLSLAEARWWAKFASKLPRRDAELVQRGLLQHALDGGCSSPEIHEIIDSITDRFVEEDRIERKKILEEKLLRSGALQLEHIEADDDQIIIAIKRTLPKFQSDRDWGGVYRILVDYCEFPAMKTKFVRRFAKMGIYPNDDYVKNLDRPLPPSIRGSEWHDHPFSYQAIQKGIDNAWPAHYPAWFNNTIDSRDFIDRRSIATTFKDNLIKATKEP